MAHGDKSKLAKQYCEKYPKSNNKAVGRALMNAYPGLWSTDNAAYCSVLYVRGCSGEKNRKAIQGANSGVNTAVPPSGFPLSCPPSLAATWETFDMQVPASILVVSDIHSPYHNAAVLDIAIKYGIGEGCTSILINGDLVDWYTLSRFRKDVTKPKLSDELKRDQEVLEWMLSFFPGQKVYKAGNHEERWAHFIWNNTPMFADIEYLQMHKVLRLEELGCSWVDDQRIVKIGKLPVLHGHEVPSGRSVPTQVARSMYLKLFTPSLSAHAHKTDRYAARDLQEAEITTWTAGCLCDIHPEYSRAGNQWNHGFAIVKVDKGGDYDVKNLRVTKTLQVVS